jgi:hypothetical protein
MHRMSLGVNVALFMNIIGFTCNLLIITLWHYDISIVLFHSCILFKRRCNILEL